MTTDSPAQFLALHAWPIVTAVALVLQMRPTPGARGSSTCKRRLLGGGASLQLLKNRRSASAMQGRPSPNNLARARCVRTARRGPKADPVHVAPGIGAGLNGDAAIHVKQRYKLKSMASHMIRPIPCMRLSIELLEPSTYASGYTLQCRATWHTLNVNTCLTTN